MKNELQSARKGRFKSPKRNKRSKNNNKSAVNLVRAEKDVDKEDSLSNSHIHRNTRKEHDNHYEEFKSKWMQRQRNVS